MTDRKYSSNAQATTLSADVNNSTTTIPVVATTGFPATPFTLALDYGTAQQEVVLVTGVAGLNLTVTRGYDSTTAQSHTLGAVVKHVHIALDFRDSRNHENASTGVHGVTGAVVGTTDTQALTHKDLSDPTNTFPTTLATDAEVTAAVAASTSSATSALAAHVADTSTHGITSEIVGKDETQTLTNKTLVSPVITGIGKETYVEKPSDQSLSSSTTFTDDTALTVALDANAVYVVDYYFAFTGTANTGGLKWQLVGPAGATVSQRSAFATLPDSAAASFAAGVGDGFSAGSPNRDFAPAYSTRVKTSGTAGNLKMQFAQMTSNATGINSKAGGFLRVRRVA